MPVSHVGESRQTMTTTCNGPVIDGAYDILKSKPPASPNGSNGSLTDEACATPYFDHEAAIETARRYAEQRDQLERRVADGQFEIGDCSNKTRLVRRLGGGTFGEVYLGESVETGDPVAVKVELNGWRRSGSSRQQLLNEGCVYRKLAGGPGIPNVQWYGMHGPEYSALVMELLGPTLYSVWAAIGERFTVKTLLMIIDQTVETLGHIHRCGFVHRDISPSNFLLNATPEGDRIQLIDFGQAKRIAAAGGGGPGSGPFQFIPGGHRTRSSQPHPVVGTPRFASVWSHAGHEPAYRDDMESLGYLWIYLARGRLPWQGIRDFAGPAKIARIGQMKAEIDVEELCAGLPQEFTVYMSYVRSLRPVDVPDHDGIRDLFRALADQFEVGDYDRKFDWSPSSSADTDADCVLAKKYLFPPKVSEASHKNAANASESEAIIAGACCNSKPSSSCDELDDPSGTPVSK